MDRLQAEEFWGRADAGRSKPLLILADGNAGKTEVFVKFANLHDELFPRKLLCEWVSAQLAVALGLPVAKPYIVEISTQFIETLPPELRIIAGAGPLLAFGSENLGNQWHVWHKGAKLPLSCLQLQLQVYVFDTLIHNWDRKKGNPNLLKSGDDIALIDHEETLQPWSDPPESFYPRPYPWENGGIDNYYQGDSQHVFWETLSRHKKKLDLDEALLPWKGLSIDQITDYAMDNDGIWDEDAAISVFAYLENIAANIDKFRSTLGLLLENA